MMSPSQSGIPLLKRAIEGGLAPVGVDVLILEVNYPWLASHPS